MAKTTKRFDQEGSEIELSAQPRMKPAAVSQANARGEPPGRGAEMLRPQRCKARSTAVESFRKWYTACTPANNPSKVLLNIVVVSILGNMPGKSFGGHSANLSGVGIQQGSPMGVPSGSNHPYIT